MIKKIVFIGLLSFLGLDLIAQTGQSFPSIEGETIDKQALSIPEDTKGKYTLVGMAFSKKSDDELESWFNPVYTRFLQDAGNAGLFADFAYDVNVYFVPMFSGLKKAAAGTAKRKALKKVDERLHPHIMFYVGEINSYRDALKLEERDQPYFFVLDKEGKIVYATSGAYSEKKMEEVETIISE
ncbi:hypothetical protein [Nafulsella turpanensis]|uniref:hypothetical protein n=1 Tax=Nafulsella turpanensis TaxID=1265690 RepID=UPI00034875A4|nr:hypothetical protein [Nafulsella turpanensis]